MRKILLISFLAICSVSFLACTASKSGSDESITEKKAKKKNKYETDQDIPLDQYLRRVSGLRITGSGPSAKVRINSMGNSSLTGNQEPLYVIDDVRMNSFAQASQIIQTSQIKQVRVLKTPSETSFYGTAGANGVIIFTMKKQQ